MSIEEAINLVNKKFGYKLISYLEYESFYVIFPESDSEYDDGIIVVDKNNKEVYENSLTNLYLKNPKVSSDKREPIKLL